MNVLSHPRPYVAIRTNLYRPSHKRGSGAQKTKLLSLGPQEFGNKGNTILLGEFDRETKSEEVKGEMFEASSGREALPDWDLAGYTGV